MNDALKAYLDGEATPAEAKAVEATLESDASLREERDQFAAISSVLRNESVEPQPIGFERTLLALAEAERVRTTPPWLVWVPRLVAAGAVCAVVALPSYFAKPQPQNDASVASLPTGSAMKSASPMEMQAVPQMGTGAILYSADKDDAFRVQREAQNQYAMDRARTSMAAYAPDRNPDFSAPSAQPRRNVPMPPSLGGSMATRGPIEPVLPPGFDVQPLPSAGAPAEAEAKVMNAPKADIEFLDKAVRQAATALKGQIVGSSKLANASGITGRTILVSLTAKEATVFADRVKKIVGQYGSVSDPIDEKPEPKRIMAKPSNASPQQSSASADAASPPDMQKQIDDLKAKREELLKEFYEDAKPVKEIDGQIADLQKQLDAQNRRESSFSPRKLVQVTLGGR